MVLMKYRYYIYSIKNVCKKMKAKKYKIWQVKMIYFELLYNETNYLEHYKIILYRIFRKINKLIL